VSEEAEERDPDRMKHGALLSARPGGGVVRAPWGSAL
jgi:hypothetical protein